MATKAQTTTDHSKPQNSTAWHRPLSAQNKPNLRKAEMNVNCFKTSLYEDFCPRDYRENKANSNPIKAKIKIPKTPVFSKIQTLANSQPPFLLHLRRYLTPAGKIRPIPSGGRP